MNSSLWYSLIAQNAPPGAQQQQQTTQQQEGPPAPGTQQQQQRPPDYSFMFMLIMMVALFYLFILRPQNKQRKELEKQINAMKKGDRVLFGGGIFGEVLNPKLKDDTVEVKIADGVHIEVARSAISKVVDRSAR